jgi:hypothetical protein
MRLFFLCFLLPCICFGNAGLFGGFGKNVQLQKTEKIQMVSETVNIYLARAEEPMIGGMDWRTRDKAYYHCRFTLKNLTGRAVVVPVGFPLESNNYALPRYNEQADEINQTDVIAKFNFVAGTKNGTYPVRYIQHDKSKKYKKLFLWEMAFKPNETIELTVSYSMSGYYGLGRTQRPPYEYRRYDWGYLRDLEVSATEIFSYVTSTADSWAGPIEKAEFIAHVGAFEKYLRKRGESEIDEDYTFYQKHLDMIPFCALFRIISPDGWREEGKKNKKTIIWEYVDFNPEKDISISYSFLRVPENISQCKKIIGISKKKYEKKRQDLLKLNSLKVSPPPAWKKSMEKNIADIFLEYYGIKTKNKAISDFLEKQKWYPVGNAPALDPTLKEYLESLSLPN